MIGVLLNRCIRADDISIFVFVFFFVFLLFFCFFFVFFLQRPILDMIME